MESGPPTDDQPVAGDTPPEDGDSSPEVLAAEPTLFDGAHTPEPTAGLAPVVSLQGFATSSDDPVDGDPGSDYPDRVDHDTTDVANVEVEVAPELREAEGDAAGGIDGAPEAVVALNEVSALYHVLERRLRGAAKGWPDHRRDELDEVLRDRFSDFFVDLPEDAIARLTEVALGNDLHQAS